MNKLTLHFIVGLLLIASLTTDSRAQNAPANAPTNIDSLLDGIDNPHTSKAITPAPNPAPAVQPSAPPVKSVTPQAAAIQKPSGIAPTYEETSIVVVRAIIVTTANGTPEEVHIPVPVYYRTRSIAFTADQVAQAQELKKRLDALIAKLEALKAEQQTLSSDYNQLLSTGVPKNALTAESATLPDYQPNDTGGIKSSTIIINKGP